MRRATSFFLDVLRLAAAGMVFIYHCVLFWFPGRAGGFVEAAGHRAVIVFFVLSGYVITYSTFRKSMAARDYVAARLSRLYSVVLPALILTAALQVIGTRFNPIFYAGFERGHEALRYLLTSVFLQSVGRSNTSPPTNGPFWSLGYEFWYYAIFGAAVFIRPMRWKLICITVFVAVSGIDSLLLMPAWVMGAALYFFGRAPRLPVGGALAGASLAAVAFLAALVFLPNWPGKYGEPPFFFSNAFLTDLTLALILAACIGLADQAFRAAKVSERLDAVMRWAADHTFSLYLYHLPLILFVTAVIPFNRANPFQVGGMIAAVLAVVLLLSLVTEAPRHHWRAIFLRFWDAVAARIGYLRATG